MWRTSLDTERQTYLHIQTDRHVYTQTHAIIEEYQGRVKYR